MLPKPVYPPLTDNHYSELCIYLSLAFLYGACECMYFEVSHLYRNVLKSEVYSLINIHELIKCTEYQYSRNFSYAPAQQSQPRKSRSLILNTICKFFFKFASTNNILLSFIGWQIFPKYFLVKYLHFLQHCELWLLHILPKHLLLIVFNIEFFPQSGGWQTVPHSGFNFHFLITNVYWLLVIHVYWLFVCFLFWKNAWVNLSVRFYLLQIFKILQVIH